ncbi:MAG TPA: glycosyltransferase [Streptosporangiaceae bacterium]
MTRQQADGTPTLAYASSHGPRISVLLPVSGVEEYLSDCLDSVLGQPVAGVEVIAVDDASPDRCGEILDARAREDTRLRVIHLTESVGPGPARNLGLAQATGEYVWFVDPDDLLTTGSMEAVGQALARTRADVLLIDYRSLHASGRTERSPGGSLRSGPAVANGYPRDGHEPGNHLLGDHATGAQQPGDHEPGGHEPGDHATGGREPEDHEPGDHATGDHATGGQESGDHVPGDHVPGDHATVTLAQWPDLINRTMTSWSKVIQRDFLRDLGVPFPPGIHEDVPVSCAVLLSARRIAVLDRVCYLYRRRRRSFLATKSMAHFAIFSSYAQVFASMDEKCWPAGRPPITPAVREAVFARAMEHYSTVLSSGLVPRRSRRDFFHRMAADFRRYRPAGYSAPPGARGMKFHLVERDAWASYAILEPLNRARVSARRALRARRAGPQDLSPGRGGVPGAGMNGLASNGAPASAGTRGRYRSRVKAGSSRVAGPPSPVRAAAEGR